MRKIFFSCLFIGYSISTYVVSAHAAWAETRMIYFQVIEQQGQAKLLLDVTGKAEYKTFLLKNPDRLVVDIKENKWAVEAGLSYKPSAASALVMQLRHGIQEGKHSRVVLDLSRPVAITGSTIHPMNNGSVYRLEVVIKGAPSLANPSTPNLPLNLPPNLPATLPAKRNLAAVPPSVSPVVLKMNPVLQRQEVVSIPVIAKLPVIVVDPGHGGDDPGTMGRFMGTQEKDITLDYAMALKAALEKEGRYVVVLTRKGDYFVPLGERVAIAQKMQGDLFISLHANSHPSEVTSGLSVYTVSETASDSEAALLANEENKEETLENVHLSKENKEMAPILINLMQRETKNTSSEFAEGAISELEKEVQMLRNTHRFAGFKVLKGIDVPAVLFELGYLSNRNEEKLLKSEDHKKKIIVAMVRAIDNHFNIKNFAQR